MQVVPIIIQFIVYACGLWCGVQHAGSQQVQISACIAVTLREFYRKYDGEETKIKWPNDLYWKDRKAGGILIESVVRSLESGVGSQESVPGSRESGVSTWEWAVIGIGI